MRLMIQQVADAAGTQPTMSRRALRHLHFQRNNKTQLAETSVDTLRGGGYYTRL